MSPARQRLSVHHDLAPRDFPDSNPYGVLALSDQLYVANAASNTLDLVHPDGTEEILAYFPNNAIADNGRTFFADRDEPGDDIVDSPVTTSWTAGFASQG